MVKKNVMAYAHQISMIKPGSKNGLTENDPEYKVLEPVVTEDMAAAGLCLKLHKEHARSAAEVAKDLGKPEEEVAKLLWDLAWVGAAFVNKIDGVDRYWHDVWVPGHMEMIVNNKELVLKYPSLGKAFDDFGKKRGPMAAGNIPVGHGPMRTIPIQTAIDGDTRSASYEEVNKYLNDNEIFSVSDCACRTAREAVGEGCGHLKENMCIQMGHAAEYYIRTGRGREINRDEAKAIIVKAEENGLMHNIPNFDGHGKTHAICNCCGCGCFAMRLAEQWQNPDMIRSNYVVKVNGEKCVACGECVETCPTNAIRLGQKLCGVKVEPKKERETPYKIEWGEDKFNPEYRTNRQVVMQEGSAPCKAGCPAHIGIMGYMKLAAQGRYTEALEMIKRENPFPAVCGRICPRLCESECTRGDIDDPVAIDEIKKFIAQQDLNAETRFIPKKRYACNDKKIAIVGSGPAGLTCAYYLSLDGYSITVFERQSTVGGMLTLGIPSYRLEKDVIGAEIDVLRELGVEFKTGVEVGTDITIQELRDEGYNAFYLAIGAQAGRMLGLEGEDADGVRTGVEFLRDVNLGRDANVSGGKVVVIGGGNVAIDVARTAMRGKAESVSMFCLESREKMPAHDEEVEEALEEDISVNNSWGPTRVVSENGKVTGIEFKKCLSVLDDSGRFNPIFDEDNKIIVEADHILLSVGQGIVWGDMLKGTNIELNRNQTIKADELTFQTTEEDIFVGGDSFTGPRLAIDAIAQGKEGAISIHRFVQTGQSLTLGRLKRNYISFDKDNVHFESGYDHTPRQKTKHVDGKKAKQTFRDLRGTFTEEQVKKEAERCLGCGVVVPDTYMCVGCGSCTTKCKFGAISLERQYDAESHELLEARKNIIKYAVKRKVRVAVNKPVKKIKSFLSFSPE